MIILYSEIKLRKDGVGLFIERLSYDNLRNEHVSLVISKENESFLLDHFLDDDIFGKGLDGLRFIRRLD